MLCGRLAGLLTVAVFALPVMGEPAKGSPGATVTQTVGGVEIDIDYSRPGVKGREVWGGLVPYGEVWRAGANDKTTIEFGEDVIIAGTRVPAGVYSFYAIPTESEWTLILNSDWLGHGTDHNESADVLRFAVTPLDAPHEEWLRYGFEDIEDNAVTLYLRWEKKKVAFRVEIPR